VAQAPCTVIVTTGILSELAVLAVGPPDAMRPPDTVRPPDTARGADSGIAWMRVARAK
jgi:hypothetical protein